MNGIPLVTLLGSEGPTTHFMSKTQERGGKVDFLTGAEDIFFSINFRNIFVLFQNFGLSVKWDWGGVISLWTVSITTVFSSTEDNAIYTVYNGIKPL